MPPQQGVSVQDLIRQEAKTAGVPPELALAVADQESGFNPTLVNPTAVKGEHATGTFQLLPSTAKTLGVDHTDPRQNIHGGVQYLRQLLDKHQGDLTAVLNEYGGVRTAGPGYADSVIGKLGKYQATGTTTSKVGQPPPRLLDLRKDPHAKPPSAEDFMTRGERLDRAVGGAAAEVGSQFDPRTPGGRRNLAGGIGGGVATALVPETAGLSALALPVIGAAVAGGGETAVEQAVGTRPPTDSPMVGALEQGGTELLGQAAPWALKGIARRGTAFAAQKIGTSALGDLLAKLPEIDEAGIAARGAIRGPAQSARDIAGQAVDQAAETGPRINLAPIKAQAREMVASARPPAEPTMAGVGYLKNAAAVSPSTSSVGRASAGEQTAFQRALQAAGVPVEDTHPLPGVLAKIEQAPDTVRFPEAHQLLRALDESVNWESPAKRQVQQITKGVRQSLRDTMSVHAPYDQAAAHYAAIVPLYTKQYAGRFRKEAFTDPGSLVRNINLQKPTPLRMLRDLLVEQSAAGGGAEEGQAAWNQVRGAVVRTKLLNRGFEGLDQQLSKVSKETRGVLFGDAQGSTVENNLRMIAAASKVARQKMSGEQAGGHVARATMLGPGNLWGALSIAKLALSGPQQRDLLEWAAYSPANTQRLVSLMTGGSPTGAAVADLLRSAGIEPRSSHERSAVGQPPPIRR